MSKRVAVIGSGSWGTVVAKIIAENIKGNSAFHSVVDMWTFEETLKDGRLLSEVINAEHVNVKYMPGLVLPSTVRAVTSVEQASKDASHLVFVIPHQFLEKTLKQIAAVARKDVVAISLIKGISFDPHVGPVLLSELISRSLNGASCAVLMGANVATEVAESQFCEATIGVREQHEGDQWMAIFHQRKSFRCTVVAGEIAAIEMLGALKNVVALAAGFCDGLGCGGNTKAAIMRIGFGEMRCFIGLFGGANAKEAFWESCGLADLITSCYGGRNRKVADLFARQQGAKRRLAEIEKEVMNGQLLQGPGTLKEVFVVLSNKNLLSSFPLFVRLHEIVFDGVPVETMLNI